MTISYLDACVWYAAAGGTSTFTVAAAVAPYYTPANCTNPSAVNSATYNYFAVNGTSEYEIGQGVYTVSGTTLTRASIFSSSNAGAAVNFTVAPVVYMGAPLAPDPAFSANVQTLAAPGNWKMTYTDGSGVQTALTVGAAGTVLTGNGVTAAPSWAAAGGTGDVIGPATNHTTYIPQWNGANSKTLVDGINPSTLLYTSGVGSVVQAYAANLTTLAAPGNWKITYTDGSGVQTALTVGAAGTALCGNGVTAAPTWQSVVLASGIGSTVEAWSANLDTVSAPGTWKTTYTDGSGVQTALTVGAAATALCGNGVTVAPSWQAVMQPAVTANLTAGFTTTSVVVGTKSTGTFTPDPTAGNIQHYINGGAHTLAPPSATCTMIIQCTNASAGALTTSGFTFVTGDVYSSVGTKKHIFYITKTNDYSQLHVQYVVGT